MKIRTRLEMTEANAEWMRRGFRSLPADHPERIVLLRQLEVAAAVAGSWNRSIWLFAGAKGIYHQLPV